MSQDDYQDIPIQDGEPVEEADEHLITFWDEMEKNQITFLDEASKRIIDLIVLLLGILFGVVAFGDKFPPPYLADNHGPPSPPKCAVDRWSCQHGSPARPYGTRGQEGFCTSAPARRRRQGVGSHGSPLFESTGTEPSGLKVDRL